jgi:hypothetical protein
MAKWRVPIGGTRSFSTFERALRRARRFYRETKQPIEVLEIDERGNETPVAQVPGRRK